MKQLLISLAIPFMLITNEVSAQEIVPQKVEWKEAAQLLRADGSLSLGFAGPINGVTNNVLLVAGGANFPDKMPWEGGKKYYSDDIEVLEKSGKDFNWNTRVKCKLPSPIAYCGNTSTAHGVVYAGGENADGLSKKAYLLQWNAAQAEVEVKTLPDLPQALTNIGLTSLGNVVYAIGGDAAAESSAAVYSLDLANQEAQWQSLRAMPEPLANAVVVAQSGRIFVVGGRAKSPSGISDLHHTTYIFSPETQEWSRGADISDGTKVTNFSAGAGVAIGKDYILITGGDNGEIFHQIETYIAQIAACTNATEKATLLTKKNALSINHKGFYKGMLLYHTGRNEWSGLGELPFPAQVTTTATLWGDAIVLSNGEIKPGVRTPKVMLGKIK